MFCKYCGSDVGEERYCPNCGADVKSVHLFGFEELAGGSKGQTNFKISDLWSGILQKHSEADFENVLFSGTSKASSDGEELKEWTRPWIYSRVFLLLTVTFSLLVFMVNYIYMPTLLPGTMFMGALFIPFSLLIMFWELNIPRDISIIQVMQVFFIGGVFSFLISCVLQEFFPFNGTFNFKDSLTIGVVEEIAKVVPVIVFIKKLKAKHILTGLLIGAAVGTGFAVFETAGYAFFQTLVPNTQGQILFNTNAMLDNIILRGVLSFGGHVVWAAISGAGVILAKGRNELTAETFKSSKFWSLFIVPIILHTLWDLDFTGKGHGFSLILCVAAWVFVIALIKAGLNEMNTLRLAVVKEK